jgi:outer membrane lipoprotein-sorting protein
MKLTAAALMILALFTGRASAQPDIDQVITSLDRLYRSQDSYSEMTMTVETPNWTRTLTMKAWSHGSDKTFIRILSPAREAGMATLRIDDEMWNYLPNTNSTVRVPPSMMSGSWMGSDITNNDIVREITYEEDYTYSYLPDSQYSRGSGEDTLYIELIPRPSAAVVWSSIICAVRTEDLIPLWERYYDSSGDLVRTITFSQVREMGGRTIPTSMEVVPADEEGNRTVIEWTDAQFDQGVDEGIFSLRNLQSGGTD